MQVTGRITAVGPHGKPTGKYNILYQDITITKADGSTVVGNIGSKKGYAPDNQEITVGITVDPQYGVKFKRFDPDYASQDTPQAPNQPQGAPNIPQGGQNAAPNAPQDNVQDRIAYAQALNLAVELYASGKIEKPMLKQTTETYYTILKTRKFPADMDSPSFEQKYELPQEEPAPTEDDMPTY